MNPIKMLKSLVVALQGGDEPRHLAAGFALGATLGLVPKGNLLSVLFLVLFFFLRVDKGLAFLSAVLFIPLGYVWDGLAHRIGYALLLAEPLKPLWTWLYNAPVLPWTKFNNSVVLGNLVMGLALYPPLYWGFMRFILFYRARWRDKVNQLPVVKAVKGLYWFKIYSDWTKP